MMSVKVAVANRFANTQEAADLFDLIALNPPIKSDLSPLVSIFGRPILDRIIAVNDIGIGKISSERRQLSI